MGDKGRELIQRVADRRRRAAGRSTVSPTEAEHGSQWRREHEDVRVHLSRVFVRERLDGGPVAGFDGGLELGQIPDETGETGERVGERGAMFVHEAAGLGQTAAELFLRLARRAHVDERKGESERQRGDDRARQENPVRERGDSAHVSEIHPRATEARRHGGILANFSP